jgi:hypothetical protein
MEHFIEILSSIVLLTVGDRRMDTFIVLKRLSFCIKHLNIDLYARFAILTTVTMKVNVTTCSLVDRYNLAKRSADLEGWPQD